MTWTPAAGSVLMTSPSGDLGAVLAGTVTGLEPGGADLGQRVRLVEAAHVRHGHDRRGVAVGLGVGLGVAAGPRETT